MIPLFQLPPRRGAGPCSIRNPKSAIMSPRLLRFSFARLTCPAGQATTVGAGWREPHGDSAGDRKFGENTCDVHGAIWRHHTQFEAVIGEMSLEFFPELPKKGMVAGLPPEISISEVVHAAGQELITSTGGLADGLNATLNRLLTGPYEASKACVSDAEGQKTEVLDSVIHLASQSQTTPERLSLLADNVACVINVDNTLDAEKLGIAYERIASAKRLKKTPLPNGPGVPLTRATLGVIFARDTAVPIESLAEKLDRLNRQHPDYEWTDMVVVLRKGIINYSVQFPGESPTGDFVLPSRGTTAAKYPPIYVIMGIRPTLECSFNKMCSFITAHLTIFNPGAELPDWNRMLEGTPKVVVIGSGYQYNLSGNLVPVPEEFRNDRYLPPRPLLIEDHAGHVLAALQFLPWQDGRVIFLRGKFPIEALLLFLRKDVRERAGVVRRPGSQISYVLPMNQADVVEMLQRLQSQSNLLVKQDPAKLVFQKVRDEGTNSPFISRLYLGILKLRETVFPDTSDRLEFDKRYEPVMEATLNARDASRAIAQLLADHRAKLAQGEVAKVQGRTLYVEAPIDNELRREVETFLNSAARALKQGMQELTRILGREIGFFFQRQQAFETGLEALKQSDAQLSAYLSEARHWSERLTKSRNAMEHEGWILPRMTYAEASGTVLTHEPEVSGQVVSEFVKFMMDRIACFFEEVSTHCLAAKLPAGLALTEIPLSQRESDAPLRFRITLTTGGMPIWNIVYHASPFEES
jgi:hypothetical protein